MSENVGAQSRKQRFETQESKSEKIPSRCPSPTQLGQSKEKAGGENDLQTNPQNQPGIEAG